MTLDYFHMLNALNNWILKEILIFILLGGGIFYHIFFESTRIYAYIKILLNRNRFKHHEVFYKIEHLRNVDFLNSIDDDCKRQIFSDANELELKQLKIVLKIILRYIVRDTFKNCFKDNIDSKRFNNTSIIKYVINEHSTQRKNLFDILRIKFKSNMTEDDFNKFIKIYYEITEEYFLIVYIFLGHLLNKKNFYRNIWLIFDQYFYMLSIYEITLPNKINRINGNMQGLKYKGYVVNDKKYKRSEVMEYIESLREALDFYAKNLEGIKNAR